MAVEEEAALLVLILYIIYTLYSTSYVPYGRQAVAAEEEAALPKRKKSVTFALNPGGTRMQPTGCLSSMYNIVYTLYGIIPSLEVEQAHPMELSRAPSPEPSAKCRAVSWLRVSAAKYIVYEVYKVGSACPLQSI